MKDKAKVSAYNKAYREANKERVSELQKAYHAANREKLLKNQKAYREANRDKIIATQKAWNDNNKDYHKQYRNTRYANDVIYTLKVRTKNMIGKALKNGNFAKLSKTEQILGCSYQQLKEHLESQFEPWMTWENRGLYNGTENYGWDIDHIIPLSTATCEADIIRLSHYTNLQPLCSFNNRNIKRANQS